jgi:alpha-D-ribose 1-methylphosphonate 5-triphosphate synthase subunit PhnH
VTAAGRLLAGAAVLFACGTRQAPDADNTLQGRDCAVGTPLVLTDSGVGALRVNTPVETLHAACDVLLDTTLQTGSEGMPERRVTVIVGGVSTTSTVGDGRVWRIEIASPRFRTHDSLGVGTTVAELRRRNATIVAGEDATYALVKGHCGMSFQLNDAPGGAATFPESARVTMVLVAGC